MRPEPVKHNPSQLSGGKLFDSILYDLFRIQKLMVHAHNVCPAVRAAQIMLGIGHPQL